MHRYEYCRSTMLGMPSSRCIMDVETLGEVRVRVNSTNNVDMTDEAPEALTPLKTSTWWWHDGRGEAGKTKIRRDDRLDICQLQSHRHRQGQVICRLVGFCFS